MYRIMRKSLMMITDRLPTGVISLDLGWSEAVENQAFDRVHRLGQDRDVFVERLVISDTVEDRVLQMQERKVKRILFP